MITTVKYTDDADRTLKLEENKNLYYVGEQNIIEGNFLLFSDTIPEYVPPVEYITVPKTDYENLQQQLLQAQGVI